MKTIPVIFPEVKINLSIDDINFDTLEKMVFDITQHIGRKVLEKSLHDIDDRLRAERPKGTLENTGKKPKYFLTRLGDIRYKRTRYIDKATGKPRYLLEEKLEVEQNQRISLSRARIEMLIATMTTYRGTEEGIELLTGWRRSHESIRRSVIREAEKILAHQERSIEKIKRLEYEPISPPPDIAYMEADATHIKLQRRRKQKGISKQGKRKRRSIEVKLGIGYTGREDRYLRGSRFAKRLKGKFAYLGISNGKKFMENLSLIAEQKLSLSGARNLFFGGDGSSWITSGILDFFPGARYLLSRFHLFRNIKRALSYRKKGQGIIKNLIVRGKIDDALRLIRDMIQHPRDGKERRALKELHSYISENRDGINAIRRIKDKGLRDQVRMTGAIEPNIDKIIAHRFKKRGMSWSIKGALSLLKLKETVINGEWDRWWLEDRSERIEIKLKPLRQLTAKGLWKRKRDVAPLIEASIPALRGPDQSEPWVKVLRELSDIDYYKQDRLMV